MIINMITETLRKEYLMVCEKYRKLMDKYTIVAKQNDELKISNRKLSEENLNLKNDIEILKMKKGVEDKPETVSLINTENKVVDVPVVTEVSDDVVEKPKKQSKRKKNTTEETLVNEPIINEEDNNSIK